MHLTSMQMLIMIASPLVSQFALLSNQFHCAHVVLRQLGVAFESCSEAGWIQTQGAAGSTYCCYWRLAFRSKITLRSIQHQIQRPRCKFRSTSYRVLQEISVHLNCAKLHLYWNQFCIRPVWHTLLSVSEQVSNANYVDMPFRLLLEQLLKHN